VAAVTAVAGAGLLLAACGSGATGAKGSTSAHSHASVSVRVAKVAKLGDVLVDSKGRTLYLFTPDARKKVTCTARTGCTGVWHPYRGSAGSAGAGARSSLVGHVSAAGGAVVTYNGWPLYTFSGDSAAGQANGEGIHSFGGHWFAVDAAGTAVKTSAASSGATTTTGSGYGSGY
jgi:predicted lipoprotein with Yx(FWY)xxD motif